MNDRVDRSPDMDMVYSAATLITTGTLPVPREYELHSCYSPWPGCFVVRVQGAALRVQHSPCSSLSPRPEMSSESSPLSPQSSGLLSFLSSQPRKKPTERAHGICRRPV